MPLDLLSVVAAGIVGGLSGVTFASLKTGQEEKAKRRALAKDRVREAVGEMLAVAIAHEAGYGTKPRTRGVETLDDYLWASKVVAAAQGLSRWRRHRIRQRLEVLVGTVNCGLAHALPAETLTPDGVRNMGHISFLAHLGYPRPFSDRPQYGLIQNCLEADRNSKDPEVFQQQTANAIWLRKELSKLADSR